MSRGVLAALLLAVYVSAVSEEFVDVESVVEAKQALLQEAASSATSPTGGAAPTLAQLKAQNEKEIEKVAAVKQEEANAARKAAAEKVVGDQVKAKQLKADTTSAAVDTQRQYLSGLKSKMDHAAKSAKLMQEIMSSTKQHKAKMKELNVKLEAAAGAQAVHGAKAAVAAQKAEEAKQKAALDKLNAKLKELKDCAACPGHAEKIVALEKQVAAQAEALRKSKVDVKMIIAASKASIEKSSTEVVKSLTAQIAEAKKKLEALEKKAIAQLKAEGAASQIDTENMASSRNDAIASAAAKAELKAASKKVVDQKTALSEAKDNLAKVIKANTEVKEKTLSKKAVLAAKVKGEQQIGKVQAKLEGENKVLNEEKEATGTKATDMKGLALTAAATNNVEKLAAVVGQTVVAVETLKKAEKKNKEEKQALSVAEEKSITAQLTAKATADKKVASLSSEASQMARKLTAPQLESKSLIAQAKLKASTAEAESVRKKAIEALRKSADLVSKSVNTTAKIEVKRTQERADNKLLEFNQAQKSQNSAAKAAKMIALDTDLKSARAATKAAQAKAANTYNAVMKKLKEACQPRADVIAPAEGLLSLMGDAIADLAKVKAEKVALKLSAKEIETLTLESLKIALDKKATSALIKQLATAKKDIKDAKATIDMVKFATEIRPAESKVEAAKASVKEAQGSLIAAKKVKAAVDQRVAKDAAKKWQEQERTKIGGPDVETLEKQKIKLNQEIKNAQKARNETKTVTKVMTSTAVKLQQAVAKQTSVATKIEAVEQKLKELPKSKSGVETPERSDELEKLVGLEKKKEGADAVVKKADAAAKAADVFAPKLAALKKTIDGATVKLKELRNTKISIQSKIEDASLELRKKGLPDTKKRELDKAVVQLTQELIAAKAKESDTRQVLDTATAKKVGVTREQRNALKSVQKAKSAAADAGNAFVRDTLKYALKEKAEKTVGIEAYQKKLDKVKASNKERAQKNEAAIKSEKLLEAKKVEKDKKLMAKKVAALEEKVQKKKEKTQKEKVAADKKIKIKKMADERDLKLKEEKAAKKAKITDAEKAEKAAVKAEQALLEKMKMEAHARRVALENQAKKVQAATNAANNEVKTRGSTEQEVKQSIAKIDTDIKKQKGTSTYDTAVDLRAAKVQKLKADELKVKNTYAASTKKARAEETKANTEVAKGAELRDKTKKKENAAKVAVENTIAEKSTKVSKRKDAAERAAEAMAQAKMTEEKNKILYKKLSVNEDLKKTLLSDAKKKLKELDGQWKSTTDQYKKNTEAYTVYAATKAKKRQEIAVRQLAEAKKDLKEDQAMLAEAVDPKVRANLQTQIDKGEILVNAKISLVNKDGTAIEKEAREKKMETEDALSIKMKLTTAEKANDAAIAMYEKLVKSEKTFKESYNEMSKKKEVSAKRKEFLKNKEGKAKKDTKDATNEASFKAAAAVAKDAMSSLNNFHAEQLKFLGKIKLKSKKSELGAKEGRVKITTAKATQVSAKAALATAVKDDKNEVNKKAAFRQKAAAEAHMAASEQATKMSDLCKANVKIAINAIAKAQGSADYKAKNLAESNQKAKCKVVEKEKERVSKDGAKESLRKTADMNMYKLMKELEVKYYKQKQKYDVAYNHIKDINTARKKSRTAKQKAKAALKLTEEKASKTKKALPGGKLKPTIKSVKKLAKPGDKKATPTKAPKTAKATKVNDPQTAMAANFTSPYVQLTADLNKRPYPSVAARRRAVVLKKTEEAQAEAKKLAKATEVKPKAKEAGFSAHYWSGVTGVKNVAEAIQKISKRKPTKVETVSAVNFASTKKFWKGLNKNYMSNFVARFRGHLAIPAKATYTFTAKCDDGCIVYIDGKAVVTNDGVKDASVAKSGKVQLSAGQSTIVVDYFSGVGKSGLVVEWEGGGQQKGPITSKHVKRMDPYAGWIDGVPTLLGDEGSEEVMALEY